MGIQSKETLTPYQVAMLIVVVSGVIMTLHFVLTGLRFFYGVDYHMFYQWQAEYLKTGVFYPENTVFFNFPLTVIAFGPYGFLPIDMAVKLKFFQTAVCCVLSVVILMKIRPGLLTQSRTALFSMLLILSAFYLTQLVYLNIYVEVGCCLLLSMYFFERDTLVWSSFFLCLAVVFKVFLFPLLLIPLIIRHGRFMGLVSGFMVLFLFLSLMIFGFHTHVDMLRAMSETYSRMRLSGIGYPFVADGFAGWQDMFNKFMLIGLISREMVTPLTVTMASLYGCLVLFTLFLMFQTYPCRMDDPGFYAHIVASLMILSLGFNFRFDHGALFLCAVPFFGNLKGENRSGLTVTLILLTLSRFFFVKLLQFFGLGTAARVFSNCFYLLSFQFIGINGLVYLVVKEWILIEKDVRHHAM